MRALYTAADRGWPVLPLHAAPGGVCTCGGGGDCKPGKHPNGRLVPHGENDATTDRKTIWRWLTTATTPLNWGIELERSGLLVIDADSPSAVTEAASMGLPPTMIRYSRSPAYVYTRPADCPAYRAIQKGQCQKIDVLTKGNFVILGTHAEGMDVYLTDDDPEPAPEWAVQIVRDAYERSPGERTAAPPDPNEPPVRLGGDDIRLWRGELVVDRADGVIRPRAEATAVDRSRTLFRIGLTLAARYATRSTIAEALAERDKALGFHKYADRRDVGESGYLAIADKAVTPYELVIPPSRKGQTTQPVTTATAPEPVEWSLPIPFGRIDVPYFPVDALPGWLGAWVEAESVATQTPPELPGMLSLAAVAATVARKVKVLIRDGWSESVNIYTVTGLGPGERKTPVLDDAVKPLHDWEKAMAASKKLEVAEAIAKKKVAEARLQHLQQQAAKAKADEVDDLTREIVQLARDVEKMVVPVIPRLVADDCTPEKLASLLNEQDGRMAVFSAEGGVFDLMNARYGNAPNLDVFLKGHSGRDTLIVDRVGRPPEHVACPVLTMGLAVQPDVIQGLAEQPRFRGRGLLARFFYSLPASRLGSRDPDAPGVPYEVDIAYQEKLNDLLALEPLTDEEGRRTPHLLHLAADAYRRFHAFERWLEPELGEGGQFAAMTDWAGKLAGAVARLTGILHMAEWAGEPDPWKERISRENVERAIRLADYLIPHARAAFAEMGASPEVAKAKIVLKWILREGRESFTKHDAHVALQGRFKTVDELEPSLVVLAKHGYIAERPRDGEKKPGRPSIVFDVNPKAAGSVNRINIVGGSAPSQLAVNPPGNGDDRIPAEDTPYTIDSIDETPNGTATAGNGSTFTPSADWQEVDPDFPCPPGGEYRMDLASGKSFARWPSLADVEVLVI